MQLARVVGTVIATVKDNKMEGIPFMVLRDLDLENQPAAGSIIATDPIGVNRGEVVLYSKGSSARQTEITRDRPNDAVICGIVDQWEVGGKTKYTK
ncbi:MAG: EutN/CcmL family microcompartment protein [Candidatus Auribacterota bacterium]|nr:EutN/CcmL family microcompartment protein [Candidatus Auribacterota bacterium]